MTARLLLTAGIVVFAITLLVAPNAFWLFRSTIRIENRGTPDLHDIVLEACEQELSIGSLPAGASRFRVLPQCGDDSVALSSSGQEETCRIYVEGEMYHVRAWFTSPTEGDCRYGSPPVSPLLVFEL